LKLRNTIIAHDDFKQIKPRMLLCNIKPHDTDMDIPLTIIVANKSISHPADLDGTQKMQSHISAAFKGAQEKLYTDIGKLRQAAITQKEQPDTPPPYLKHYGTEQIAIGGTRLKSPDLSEDPWLNLPEPDFSLIHNGFHYENLSFRRNFYGPEHIKLPNGGAIEISP